MAVSLCYVRACSMVYAGTRRWYVWLKVRFAVPNFSISQLNDSIRKTLDVSRGYQYW